MTLTEQWKKGKLKAGLYYVKNEFENIFISEYSEDYDYIGDKVVKDFFTEISEITEVIAPVPSYKEWNQLHKFLEEFNALDIAKENQQLKDLLKQWVHFYPIVLYEHEGILKTKDIVELYDKTTNAIGEKK